MKIFLTLVIIGVVILVIVGIVKNKEEKDRLSSAGALMQRPKKFWEYATTFVLSRDVPVNEVASEINRRQNMVPAGVRFGSDSGRVTFLYQGYKEKWNVHLTRKQGNIYTLRMGSFEYSESPNTMALNAVFTLCERAMLGVDPSCQATTEYSGAHIKVSGATSLTNLAVNKVSQAVKNNQVDRMRANSSATTYSLGAVYGMQPPPPGSQTAPNVQGQNQPRATQTSHVSVAAVRAGNTGARTQAAPIRRETGTTRPAAQRETKSSSYSNERQKIECLKQYKELLDSGVITEEEFMKKKEELLKDPD